MANASLNYQTDDPPAAVGKSPPSRIATGLARLGGGFAGGAVVFMGLATIYDVVMRYFFAMPTSWATEISTYALISTIFIGAAAVHLQDGHVRVDLLVGAVSPPHRRVLNLIAAWTGLLFVLLAAWQASCLVVSDWNSGTRIFSLLLTPGWVPKLPIAVGLWLLAGAILAEIEDLNGHGPGWRRWLPHALCLVVLPLVLIGFGIRPPVLSGTKFDLGSVAVLATIWIAALAASGPRIGGWTVLVSGGGIALFLLGKSLGLTGMMLAMAGVIGGYLVLGIRIAFVLGLVGAMGIYFFVPLPFPIAIAERIFNSVNSFSLTAVPLYVLMGSLLVRSNLSAGLFALLSRALARFPGGLTHAAIGGCGVFSAVSGSSVATAATMGAVACPEMNKRGYDQRLTYGAVAAGGTLGILIPPSVPLIIYGITVGAPITALFAAGIGPGIMLMLMFMLTAAVWALLVPGTASRGAAEILPVSRRDLIDACLVLVIVALVIGTLYGGFATAGETGAIAAGTALVISTIRGRMTLRVLGAAIHEAVTVTSFILLIMAASSVLTYAFDYLRLSQQLMDLVIASGASRWTVLALVILVYIVLGMFLDSISMMVLTLPVVFPMALHLGFDPIWFGIIVVIAAEIGLITPPVGMNLFVLQGIDSRVSIRTIAVGAVPFIGAMLVAILLLCIWPDIALWPAGHLK